MVDLAKLAGHCRARDRFEIPLGTPYFVIIALAIELDDGISGWMLVTRGHTPPSLISLYGRDQQRRRGTALIGKPRQGCAAQMAALHGPCRQAQSHCAGRRACFAETEGGNPHGR